MYPAWVTRVSPIPTRLYVLFYFVGSHVAFTSRTTEPFICWICMLFAGSRKMFSQHHSFTSTKPAWFKWRWVSSQRIATEYMLFRNMDLHKVNAVHDKCLWKMVLQEKTEHITTRTCHITVLLQKRLTVHGHLVRKAASHLTWWLDAYMEPYPEENQEPPGWTASLSNISSNAQRQ